MYTLLTLLIIIAGISVIIYGITKWRNYCQAKEEEQRKERERQQNEAFSKIRSENAERARRRQAEHGKFVKPPVVPVVHPNYPSPRINREDDLIGDNLIVTSIIANNAVDDEPRHAPHVHVDHHIPDHYSSHHSDHSSSHDSSSSHSSDSSSYDSGSSFDSGSSDSGSSGGGD